jgi:hypothetical protein
MELINSIGKAGLNRLEKINHISFKSEEHSNYMIANNVVNHDDFVARSENIMSTLGAKLLVKILLIILIVLKLFYLPARWS